jgi:hypothetical protein
MKTSEMHELIAEKLFVCGAENECFMELFRMQEQLEIEAEHRARKLANFKAKKELTDETFIGAA